MAAEHHGVVEAEYFATWPVFVVGDDPDQLTFQVAIDDVQFLTVALAGTQESAEEPRRSYVTSTTRRRLHQHAFRTRVLHAYRKRCALCRLKHSELLDAAHIVPDSDPLGEPVVTNGLALCKLHHAAFDQNFIGIGSDLLVRIRPDVLKEEVLRLTPKASFRRSGIGTDASLSEVRSAFRSLAPLG